MRDLRWKLKAIGFGVCSVLFSFKGLYEFTTERKYSSLKKACLVDDPIFSQMNFHGNS